MNLNASIYLLAAVNAKTGVTVLLIGLIVVFMLLIMALGRGR